MDESDRKESFTTRVVDLATVKASIPIWSILTGTIGLISFGIGLGWLAWNVRDTVTMNIARNDEHHLEQMRVTSEEIKLLKQIICLTQEVVYAQSKAGYKYDGNCERALTRY